MSADLLTRENLLRAGVDGVTIMNEVRDAGQIAEEVIAQLSSARVTVRLVIEALDGVPDEVVRIVSENSRTLKYGVRGGVRPAQLATDKC